MESEKLILGIVTAPGISRTLCEKINYKLKEILNNHIDDNIRWQTEVVTDHITGAAENANSIMKQAIKIKKDKKWDYVISLTDLPIFANRAVVMADINRQNSAAQISLPAFGMLPRGRQIKKTIYSITKELYDYDEDRPEMEFTKHEIGVQSKDARRKVFHWKMIERKEMKNDEHFSVRFFVYPRWLGMFIILAGMTVSNRPWSIMPSFKRVIGLAFATGSYMLIFNTLWKLSALYGSIRFITIMAMAMIAMVIWVIFAHNLWEKKQYYQSQKLRLMYNVTTIMTLTLSVFFFYIGMFLLFSIAAIVFVPVDIFSEVLNDDIVWTDYIKLAWLITSSATVAGAIGAGLENEESVKQITYGYRQYLRSKKIERMEEEEEKRRAGESVETSDYDK